MEHKAGTSKERDWYNIGKEKIIKYHPSRLEETEILELNFEFNTLKNTYGHIRRQNVIWKNEILEKRNLLLAEEKEMLDKFCTTTKYIKRTLHSVSWLSDEIEFKKQMCKEFSDCIIMLRKEREIYLSVAKIYKIQISKQLPFDSDERKSKNTSCPCRPPCASMCQLIATDNISGDHNHNLCYISPFIEKLKPNSEVVIDVECITLKKLQECGQYREMFKRYIEPNANWDEEACEGLTPLRLKEKQNRMVAARVAILAEIPVKIVRKTNLIRYNKKTLQKFPTPNNKVKRYEIIFHGFLHYPDNLVKSTHLDLTGITFRDIRRAKPNVEIRHIISNILKDKIVIFKNATCDLNSLAIKRPKDTRDIETFYVRKVKKQPFSLRSLVSYIFGIQIQEGTHSPVVDCNYTLKLYKLIPKDFWKPQLASLDSWEDEEVEMSFNFNDMISESESVRVNTSASTSGQTSESTCKFTDWD